MFPQLPFFVCFVTLDHYLFILIILKNEHKTPTSTPLQLSTLCVALESVVLAPEPSQKVKNLPAMQETQVQSLGWDDPLEKEVATHSTILAWRIPMGRGVWQSTVRHNWATNTKHQCLTYSHFKETLGPSCKTLPRVASKLLHFFSNKCPLCL